MTEYIMIIYIFYKHRKAAVSKDVLQFIIMITPVLVSIGKY